MESNICVCISNTDHTTLPICRPPEDAQWLPALLTCARAHLPLISCVGRENQPRGPTQALQPMLHRPFPITARDKRLGPIHCPSHDSSLLPSSDKAADDVHSRLVLSILLLPILCTLGKTNS